MRSRGVIAATVYLILDFFHFGGDVRFDALAELHVIIRRIQLLFRRLSIFQDSIIERDYFDRAAPLEVIGN